VIVAPRHRLILTTELNSNRPIHTGNDHLSPTALLNNELLRQLEERRRTVIDVCLIPRNHTTCDRTQRRNSRTVRLFGEFIDLIRDFVPHRTHHQLPVRWRPQALHKREVRLGTIGTNEVERSLSHKLGVDANLKIRNSATQFLVPPRMKFQKIDQELLIRDVGDPISWHITVKDLAAGLLRILLQTRFRE
jgi:hypothetical protein